LNSSSVDFAASGALVSVYIPTKNRKGLLALAVRSVLAQTWRNVEVLVVDDGSTDSTADLMRELCATDSRVRFFQNDSSRGACAARNQAIRESRGQFVTGLDDDDEFLPHHIQGLVGYWHLLESLKVDASCIFVPNLQRNGATLTAAFKRGGVSAVDLFQANHVGNQVFAPRERYFEAGLFDECMPAWQDLEFFFRMLEKFGPAKMLDVPSYVFDCSPRTDRISNQQRARIFQACNRMYSKHGHGDPRILQQLLLQVYSPYYGFGVGVKDLWQFMKVGFWPRGWIQMVAYFWGSKVR